MHLACLSKDKLYTDKTHPNEIGHLFIAAVLAEALTVAFEGATPKDSLESSSISLPVAPKFPASLHLQQPRCYSMLSPTIKRLRVTDFRGFWINERPQRGAIRLNHFKRCWEANDVGSYIEIWVPPCSSIELLYYMHSTPEMGMVSVAVDGIVYIQKLNGWFDKTVSGGWASLPSFKKVVEDLEQKEHLVRIQVINDKQYAEAAGHNFQVIAIATTASNSSVKVTKP